MSIESDLEEMWKYIKDHDYSTLKIIQRRLVEMGAPNLNGMGGHSSTSTTLMVVLLCLAEGPPRIL